MNGLPIRRTCVPAWDMSGLKNRRCSEVPRPACGPAGNVGLAPARRSAVQATAAMLKPARIMAAGEQRRTGSRSRGPAGRPLSVPATPPAPSRRCGRCWPSTRRCAPPSPAPSSPCPAPTLTGPLPDRRRDRPEPPHHCREYHRSPQRPGMKFCQWSESATGSLTSPSLRQIRHARRSPDAELTPSNSFTGERCCQSHAGPGPAYRGARSY